MNKKIVRISALCVLISASIFAQKKGEIATPNELNEVVISDSKFALPKEKSGKVIVKITAADLAKKQGQSLATVLSTVAGVEINGNQSNAGRNLGVYIRGSRSRQTLIIIDGVPVSDASEINLVYDLRLLPVEQVESVEIMKGASSTLYGSGAASGVINITLKKGTQKSISGNVYMNAGTQTTADKTSYRPAELNQGFNFGAKNEKINYFASLNSSAVQGISEAKGVGFEDDLFQRVNSLVKIGFTPTKKLSLDFFANYDRIKNEFDSGAYADNPDNYNISEQFRVGFAPKYKYNKGEVVMNATGNLITRELLNFGSITDYKSRNLNADAFNKYEISDQLFVVTGVQFQFQEMSINSAYTKISNSFSKFNIVDPYLNFVYNSDFGLNINVGARLNHHSDYGNHMVYNVNPSFSFKNIPFKLLGSFSTAYITPSLYQLYSTYGNLDLKPEDNKTFEVGFEVKLLEDKLTLNSVGFYREEDSAIEFYSNPLTYVGSYFNANGKYNAKGIETMIAYAITNKLTWNANYTFTQVESKAVNNTFPNVKANLYNPKHKINTSLDFQFLERAYFGVSYQFLDKRDGFTGYPPVVSTLGAYKLVNATAKYNIIKNKMTIFGAVTNIFNEDFEETIGYSTRGRNFKIGFTILF
ncbi:TonB-dependent receptor plug domain-containing protein [Flavobacterium sp.]|uniref:TonB-dependent receptor plug domain-containing protein n=1 Tax=Flavobacterium sp. TaxID=239 RepID=UPI003C671D8D